MNPIASVAQSPTPSFRVRLLVLGDVVQSKTKKLVSRIKEAISQDEPIDLHHGYRALAVDIITDYAFDNCYNQLEMPNFGADFFDMTYELIPRGWVVQAFPPLLPLSNLVTLGIAKRLSTGLYLFLQFRTVGWPISPPLRTYEKECNAKCLSLVIEMSQSNR